MTENIYRVLGIQSREDSISNAITYAFNQSQEFRNGFLQQICEKQPDDYGKCTAYSRVFTGNSGIPDIVLVCESSEAADLIIIENKLKADEGRDQTERYASPQSVAVLRHRLCSTYENVTPSFVFFTLFPDQKPTSDKFVVKRHFDLVGIFGENNAVKTLADQLIHDWIALVSRFHSKSHTNFNDRIIVKLQDDDGLDGGYLYFRTFLSEVELPTGLEIEDFFRDSRQGRRYYGAVISKQDWHPSQMTEINGSWNLDPRQVFNIHFEPQFNVLNGVFSVFIHYEVNPYETAAWVTTNILKDQYDAYQERRNRFAHILQGKNIKEWVYGGGSNQIAKANFDFREFTLKDAKTAIENLFQVTTSAIDNILSEL